MKKPPLKFWLLGLEIFQEEGGPVQPSQAQSPGHSLLPPWPRNRPSAGHLTSHGRHLSELSVGHVQSKTTKCLLSTSTLFLLSFCDVSLGLPRLRQPLYEAPYALSLSALSLLGFLPQIVAHPWQVTAQVSSPSSVINMG